MRERRIREFGNRLRQLRETSGVSVRKLAKAAGVSFALLTCIENARRGAGRSTLERLGGALGLEDGNLDAFILDGMVICKRDRLLGAAEGYPAWVLNALPLALRRLGVVPEAIESCEAVLETKHGKPTNTGADLVVHLTGGRTVNVSFKVSYD